MKRFVTLFALVVVPSCAWFGNHEPPAAIFLIVADTLRPDRLSCYGYEAHETTTIDAIARRGVLFERAQSVASWTLPSMGAMMTSRYPTQIGLVERPGPEGKVWEPAEKRGQLNYTLPRGFRTLGELMSDAGYYTAGFVNQPFINVDAGFLSGFREWCYTVGEQQIRWQDTRESFPLLDYPEGQDPGDADPVLLSTFDAWLGRNAKNKPFVWLQLLKTHLPYSPPPRHMPGNGPEDWKDLEGTDYYDGEVRELDELIAMIVDSIDRHVGLERSLVVFTSDHGEAFFEHGDFEHGHSLHREVVRVPLIVAGPGVPKNRVVRTFVRTTDIMPTIVDLVGIPELQPVDIEGASLVSLFREEGTDRPVYSEGMLYGSSERSLVIDGFKLLYDEQQVPHYRLYHVEEDPWETVDVAARHAAQLEKMRHALTTLHGRLLQDWETGDRSEPPASVEVDEKVQRSIRALGY